MDHPTEYDKLSLELTKPRRIASVQLLGTVRQLARGQWVFDTAIATVLPTLDTPAEVANPKHTFLRIRAAAESKRPQGWTEGDFDFALELGHQTGDENTRVKASFNDLFSPRWASVRFPAQESRTLSPVFCERDRE